VTVFELVEAFGACLWTKINKRTAENASLAILRCVCKCDKAKKLLGWEAKLSIDEGIRSALEWGKIRESILSF
jgi:UDP-glucose 4-epimerase